METTIEELAPYMRGWRSYFGFCETPEVLVGLTRWVRPATQGGHVAAVENTAPSQSGSVGTRGTSAAGQQYGRKRARPLVPRESQGLVCGAFEYVLQIAWASLIILGSVGVTNSNRRVRTPVRTVVWQGSAGDRRPYADQTRQHPPIQGFLFDRLPSPPLVPSTRWV